MTEILPENAPPPRIIHALLKFGSPEHIDELYRRGAMFMRSIGHFRDLEADELRGDPSEGLEAFYQAEHVRLTLTVGDKTFDIDGRSGLVDAVRLHVDVANVCSVFCSTAIEEIGVYALDPQHKTFGGSCLWIQNVAEFMRRVKAAAEISGLQTSHGLVRYVPRQTYSGRMGPFRKFSEHEWQREFRILVVTEQDPFRLEIGSIEDISAQFSTDHVDEVELMERAKAP